MSRYVVDGDAIHGAHLAVRSTASRLQSESAAMLAQLQALQDSWTGQASVAFQGVVQDWRATQVRVEESLASINEALALAGRQYDEVEQGNTRLFAG
ncbi:WXG100 family type VII secretion target [Agrococcus sp. TF02-05]|uniref:WXG100 family type VII secretion target n=1 Tax=Agrococcus sp. TF02-05 TaxID=2815211 RepID=UPI001AA14F13|nr:WXG100 family type VII secretion target [Agrococcus sp. TF02-05]MBO1769559.1 WXG100 family type VII secretion target [Agrococcus sp. TF02-05]